MRDLIAIACYGFMRNMVIEHVSDGLVEKRNFLVNISVRKSFILVDLLITRLIKSAFASL